MREANTVEAQKARLKNNFSLWGLETFDVPGDNNCQFHAVSDQLSQNGVKGWDGLQLRCKVCEWLADAGDKVMDESGIGERTALQDACGVPGEKWGEYVNEMRQHDTTWGDEATLLAIATLFEAEVVVVSSISEDCVRTITPPEHWRVPVRIRIFVGHYHEYHYTSCRVAGSFLA